MPSLEKKLYRHLKAAGGEPFITGGTVRDKLLGIPVRDTDVVVFGMTESMLRRELEHFGQVLNYGKSFRVLQVRGIAIEFSLPRTSVNHENPSIMKRLQKDAEGRDFTVNALYMNPLTDEIKDPLGGMKDLGMRRLRMTTRRTFEDDPLRVLRAVQLSARMGFSVEATTLEVMRHVSLQAVAKERLYEELNKWLLGPDPAKGWNIMEVTGHIPEICDIGEGFHRVMPQVLTCASTLKNQSQRPVQWMWGVLLSTCLLSNYQHRQRSDQEETLKRYTSQFGALSNHLNHLQFVSEILWGVKNVQHYAMRKPDIARLSLGVNLDELTLTLEALKPLWSHIGKQAEIQKAMNRIKKLKPQERITPLVKGADLKKWGFTEGKTMGILLQIAFQMQLEGVTVKQLELYFKNYQRILQKIGH